MGCFLYYKPGVKQPPTTEHTDAWGLGYAIDECTGALVRGGTPDGGPGALVADRKRLDGSGLGLRMNTAEQEWREMPSGLWVGWWKEAFPSQQDLARDEMLRGFSFEMADGLTWRVPKVRDVSSVGEPECALPSVYVMGADGKLKASDPIQKYQQLWEDTAWCWEAMVAGEEVDDQQAIETCGKVFSVNYCVAAFELCLLGVFSNAWLQTPAQILAFVNSYPTLVLWLEDQKKTASQAETNSAATEDGAAA